MTACAIGKFLIRFENGICRVLNTFTCYSCSLANILFLNSCYIFLLKQYNIILPIIKYDLNLTLSPALHVYSYFHYREE
jgi:hypothetical protein